MAAGAALATGTLLKAYPLGLTPWFALPDLLRRNWSSPARLLGGFVVVGAALTLSVFLALGVTGLEFIGYQTSRGVQIESLPGSLMLLGHVLAGVPAQTFIGFQAWQVRSPLAPGITTALAFVLVALALALVLSTIASYRRYAAALQVQVSHILAALVFAVLAFPALSPEYLAWLLPFAALSRRAVATTMLAICVLTGYLVPFGYRGLTDPQLGSVVILALRNVLLVGLFAWLVAPGATLALRTAGQGALALRKRHWGATARR